MITGEIAILFTSAAGIGAAAATWVYDRRLAKRLTDLQRDVDYLKDQIRGHADMLVKTEAAIDKLRRPITVESPLTVHVPDVILKRPVTPDSMRAVGKPSGLWDEVFTPDPEAKHPLYAKTGLPNQPVASLRPDTPARRCSVCCYTGHWPGSKPCPNCGD